ncbi:unnamed protein product, partial [Citrullus colocynthis]
MKSINLVIDHQDSDQVLDEDRDDLVLFPDVTCDIADKKPHIDPNTDDDEKSDFEHQESVSDTVKCSNKVKKNHPSENIIGELSSGVTTQRKDKVDHLKLIGN